MSSNIDVQLWNRLKMGDTEALSCIFNEQYDSLYYYGLKISQDDQLVSDCIQDLFLKLWQKRKNLSQVEFIKPYLIKSLRRLLIDRVKPNKKGISNFYSESVTLSHEELMIANSAHEEQCVRLKKALSKLSQRQREAIYLRFYEGLKYEEVATAMDLNVQSVRNLMHNAMKILRKKLSKELILMGISVAILIIFLRMLQVF